jgi:hypothetical protein
MVATGTDVQWGDVAGWVGSIATSVALLLTYGLLRLTRREQRTLQADERQAQARKISAWCERVDSASGNGPDSAVVRLQNSSDEPIYGVRVAVGASWWSEQIKYEELDLSYVIAPNYNKPHVVKLRLARTADGHPEPSPPVEIIFSDASGGKFWHRDRYGGLREITGQAPPSSVDILFKRPVNSVAGASVRRVLRARLSRAHLRLGQAKDRPARPGR